METFTSISSAISIDTILEQLTIFGPKFVAGLIVFGFFWLVSKALQRILHSLFEHQDMDPDIEELIEQCVRITIMLIGIVTSLGTVGINVGALVTSLGLVGFAIGYALKDAISNFLSGVLILIYRPFKRGDTIHVAAHTGLVIDVDLRYTMLDTQAETILVPNAILFSNVVKVMKELPASPPEVSQ